MHRNHRLYAVLPFLLTGSLGGCTDEGQPTPEPDPEAQVLTITTPVFKLAPGDEQTLCYYTSLPSDTEIGVKRFSSTMSAGSHHMILFTTRALAKPEGTLGACGGGSQTDPPLWAYAAQEPVAQTQFPDGVGVVLGARQPFVIQMHYFNLSEQTIDATVKLDIDAYRAGETFQKASAFVTFNSQINIPPQQTSFVTGSCSVPAGAKFFTMSTHSHSFTTRAEVKDGGAMLVETLDWEHPGSNAWSEAPFFSFASGKLDYRCDYRNTTNVPVMTGDSAITNEMCMAVGYFFPAERTVICLNSTVIPL